MVSADGLHPAEAGAPPRQARSIEIELSGEPIELRENARPAVYFATVDHWGLGESVDFALVELPLPEDSPLRSLAGLPLSVDVGDAEGRTIVASGGFVHAGYPGPDAIEPRAPAFKPERWNPDTTAGTQGLLLAPNHPFVRGGYSGGPLFARVDGKLHWIGITSQGGYSATRAGFVLTGYIKPFIEAVSTQHKSLKLAPFESMRSKLATGVREHVARRCRTLPWTSQLTLMDLWVDRSVARTAPEPDQRDGNLKPLAEHVAGAEGLKRLVLIGGPGSGKSTLLRHFAIQETSPRITVDVRLPKLRGTKADWAALLEQIEVRAGRYARELLEGDDADPRGEVSLLLDGYDEVGDKQAAVDVLLEGLWARLPRTALVLATRPPFEQHQLKGWQRLQVKPLGPDRQLKLLRKLVARFRELLEPRHGGSAITDESLTTWVGSIQTDASYGELRGNPLWLTLAARVIADKNELPDSRTHLMARVLDVLEEGKHVREADAHSHQPAPGPYLHHSRLVLQALAYRMTCESRVDLSRRELSHWIEDLADESKSRVASSAARLKLLRQELPPVGEHGFSTRYIDWLGQRSILAPLERELDDDLSGGSADDVLYGFWHRLMQDYLTACEMGQRAHILRDYEQLLAPAIGRTGEGDLKAWAEVLVFLEELTRDAGLVLAILRRAAKEGGIWYLPLQPSFKDLGSTPEPVRRRAEALLDIGLRGLGVLRDRSHAEWAALIDALPPWPMQPEGVDQERNFLRKPAARVVAYHVLPGRTTEASRRTLARALVVYAKLPETRLPEVGAIVQCLERMGEKESVVEVLNRFPQLNASDVESCFATVTAERRSYKYRGREEKYPIRGRPIDDWRRVHDLWCRCPSEGTEQHSYRMGSPADDLGRLELEKREIGEPEGPVEVTGLETFWIAATTTTWKQFTLFAKSPQGTRGRDTMPISGVTWYEAYLFCRWLEKERRRDPTAWAFLPLGSERHVFRLPTEVEWEFAARAGTSTPYWSGSSYMDLDEVGWWGGYRGDSSMGNRELHSVCELPPNPWGLFDVHGNIQEWCDNWFDPWDVGLDAVASRFLAHRGEFRKVLRGGFYGASAAMCRSAARNAAMPHVFWGGAYGFRVALACPTHDLTFRVRRVF